MIVINNPHKQIEKEDLAPLDYVYFISGFEEGEKEHTPHLQCFIILKERQSIRQLQKAVFCNAHMELARGSNEDNRTYCSKDGDFVEFGEFPISKQGTRTDLINIRDGLIKGKSDLDFIMDDNTILPWSRNIRSVDRMRILLDPPKARPNTKVAFIYGRPGTGKSSFVERIFPNAYNKDNTKWWNFYDGQDTVIWDEFGGWSCTPSEFNKVFDKYKHQVETKGGFVPLRADKLIIISNFLPGQWWNVNKVTVDIASVTRRLHRVYWFKALGEEADIFDDYESFDRTVRGVQ